MEIKLLHTKHVNSLVCQVRLFIEKKRPFRTAENRNSPLIRVYPSA